jgi:hypothetical protein
LQQARLEAQQYRLQLEQACRELEQLRSQRSQQDQEQQRQHQPAVAAEELQEARLAVSDSRYKLQLTELELAKQLDALQELQWQLDCVVAQLGLQPVQQQQGGTGSGSGCCSGRPDAAQAEPEAEPAYTTPVDYMMLLSKVEELSMVQLQMEEYKRRLAFAEAQLAGAAHSHAGTRAQPPQPQQHNCQQPGVALPAAQELGSSSDCAELGASGKQLVGELLQENEALRRRLGEAEEQYSALEERYSGLERDYEVELLLKAETCQWESAAGAPGCTCAGTGIGAGGGARQAHLGVQFDKQRQQAMAAAAGAGSPSGTRQHGPAASQSMDHIVSVVLLPLVAIRICTACPALQPWQQPASSVFNCPAACLPPVTVQARQRLEFRLQEKDKQVGKLREVIQELEGKLVEAYKRQADL